MKRFSLLSLCLLGCAVQAAPTHQPLASSLKHLPTPAYYDFKGAYLNMTLEEWRAMPVPETLPVSKISNEEISNTIPICDSGNIGGGLPFYRSKRGWEDQPESLLKVVTCSYAYNRKYSDIKTEWEFSNIKIARYGSDRVFYKFLDGRLYQIFIECSSSADGDIISGLVQKFGKPSQNKYGLVQNGFGAKFDHIEKAWDGKLSYIYLESPSRNLNVMSLIYETNDGRRKIVEQIERTRKADSKL